MMKHFLWISAILLSCYACNNNKKGAEIQNISTLDMQELQDESSMYLLIGTYTQNESNGIYVYQFDTVSGYSKFISMVDVDNPSYLAISKNEKFVYSVTENDDESSAANAFSFDKKSGKLTFLNKQLTGGGSPCYINIDSEGKHVITADYSGGDITTFNTNEDGSLTPASQVIRFSGKGVDVDRQKQPHLHCVQFSPDENYLFANDLGTDKIHKFDVNKTSEPYLQSGNPPFFKVADGSGPRHLEFHPNGKYAYMITEISGNVLAFNYNDGILNEFQSVVADTLGVKGSGDIHITPDGHFLYASNRLEGDGLAIFSINQTDGTLTKVGYQTTGIHPRNFVITPNGNFLLVAARDSNSIQVFSINAKTGLLEDTYRNIELDMPVCLKFASFN